LTIDTFHWVDLVAYPNQSLITFDFRIGLVAAEPIAALGLALQKLVHCFAPFLRGWQPVLIPYAHTYSRIIKLV